jgi:glutamate-ammonia-ligase adenylyltransferase
VPPPAAARREAEQTLERFLAGLDAEQRAALEPLSGTAVGVLAASEFVARFVRRRPGAFHELLGGGRLVADESVDSYRQRLQARVSAEVEAGDEAALKRVLRQFRVAESVRIAWRDLAQTVDIDTCLREQSDLADACVQVVLRRLDEWLAERHGRPVGAAGEAQELLVLGMGKLGGRELNFSSDIDLVFVYGEPGETDGPRPLEHGDYFTRLGQCLIRVLDERTADGFGFRVDMRLRPFGGSGPLVVHAGQLEQYLLAQAREWERFALVKARPLTGDPSTVAAVESLLRPFVFRRYLDFGAFEALRDLKARLEREVARKGLDGNVKYGPGGIREIEFIAQAFQLIRGGREPALRARGLVPALEALVDTGDLDRAEVDALIASYRELRRIENRLQIHDDARVHALPREEVARERLAWSLGHDDWRGFAESLDRAMHSVHECFGRVFNLPADGASDRGVHPLTAAWEGELDPDSAEERLREAGFDDPGEALRRLTALRESARYRSLSATARARLDRLVPLLLVDIGNQVFADAALARVLELLEAVARRSVYLSLLCEHDAARQRLVELCAASSWIARFVTHHPILLDELIDPATLFEAPDRETVEAEIGHVLADADDLERQMDALRQTRQVNVLRVAAADITGRLPLMRVSDHLTWIAEAVLGHVHALAHMHNVRRHGRPRVVVDGDEREPDFGIVAYGKLGGIELGYGSDLDLVLVHEDTGEDLGTDGDRPMDNAAFFARLAQRLLHILSTPTPAGVLYEVDTRLRPNGVSGPLVSALRRFERYQLEQAWTWEHQALVRARMVVGTDALRERFDTIRTDVLCRPRDAASLREEVVSMRERMRRELARGEGDRFDLKQGPGGVTDIEFVVQYSVLANAHATRSLVRYTDNIRLLESLAEAGYLTQADAQALIDAYRAFRARIHRLALLEMPAVVEPDAELQEMRAAVMRIWTERMGPYPGASD